MAPGQFQQNKQPWWKDLATGAGLMAAKYIMSALPGGAISALKNGGVVTKPTVGLVGEAGPEEIVKLRKRKFYGEK